MVTCSKVVAERSDKISKILRRESLKPMLVVRKFIYNDLDSGREATERVKIRFKSSLLSAIHQVLSVNMLTGLLGLCFFSFKMEILNKFTAAMFVKTTDHSLDHSLVSVSFVHSPFRCRF